MSRQRTLNALLACACLISAGPARADVVTDWNSIAMQAVGAARARAYLDPRPCHGPRGDARRDPGLRRAVRAVCRRHPERRRVAGRRRRHGRARRARGALIPARRAGPSIPSSTITSPPTASRGTQGWSWAMWLPWASSTCERATGASPRTRRSSSAARDRANGARRSPPDAAFSVPMVAPWLGDVVPFTLKDPEQLRASPPPPHLGSGKYAHDYNEVKALGGSVGCSHAGADRPCLFLHR